MSTQDFKNWETPESVIQAVKDVLLIKHFDIDVAASRQNAKAFEFIDKEKNGLLAPWSVEPLHTYAWCNPPYTGIEKWLDKAISESNRHVTTIMLLPASIDTKWFHKARLSDRCSIGFGAGRIRFVDPRTGEMGRNPAIGNIIIVVSLLPTLHLNNIAQKMADAVSKAIKGQ